MLARCLVVGSCNAIKCVYVWVRYLSLDSCRGAKRWTSRLIPGMFGPHGARTARSVAALDEQLVRLASGSVVLPSTLVLYRVC